MTAARKLNGTDRRQTRNAVHLVADVHVFVRSINKAAGEEREREREKRVQMQMLYMSLKPIRNRAFMAI
jgi:hypothetical protein